MRYRVSLGAFDLDQLHLPTQLKLSKAGDEIRLLGSKDTIQLEKGELCYYDTTGAYNMDLNYRDADRTKVTTDTNNLVINVEGIYDISREEVERSLRKAVEIIHRFCGGKVKDMGIIE